MIATFGRPDRRLLGWQHLDQEMLFSGKFGATESPSAALVGLKRGPGALLLGRFSGRRCHSGTTGALSEVSSV
jgi:hypothetical protein